MKTENEIRKEYPLLPEAQILKLIASNDMHKFLSDKPIMVQQKAFNHLIRTFYVYDDKNITLKELCEKLAKMSIKIDGDKVFMMDQENGGYYELSKTAIEYIKHLRFEKSIKGYYIQKQSEKTETIYFDVNKFLEGEK